MTWARLDPDAPQHPKHHHGQRGKLERFGFFAASLCYAARFLTNGHIPAGALDVIFPGTPPATCRRLAAELVASGLWEACEGGWQIHDFLKYQPTREEELAARHAQHVKSVAGGLARASMAFRIAGRFTSLPTSQDTSPPAGESLAPSLVQAGQRHQPGPARPPARHQPLPQSRLIETTPASLEAVRNGSDEERTASPLGPGYIRAWQRDP